MSAPHVVPLGVSEAESKREAAILAEYLRGEQTVVREHHQLHVYFVAPSWRASQIIEIANGYRRDGFHVESRFLEGEDGVIYGVEMVGDLR